MSHGGILVIILIHLSGIILPDTDFIIDIGGEVGEVSSFPPGQEISHEANQKRGLRICVYIKN